MSGDADGEWRLRLARPDDASGMATLGGGGPVALPARGGHSLVAHCGGALAGMLLASTQRRALRIERVHVRPERRCLGIGAGLVRACLIDAANTGFRSVTAAICPSVPDGALFYARFGFVQENSSADDLVLVLGGE